MISSRAGYNEPQHTCCTYVRHIVSMVLFRILLSSTGASRNMAPTSGILVLLISKDHMSHAVLNEQHGLFCY